MYANKNYKTDGKVYYMPNKIFDENFSPYEFMIYCFLVSVGDSKGVSFINNMIGQSKQKLKSKYSK